MTALALRTETAPIEAPRRVIRVRCWPDAIAGAPVDVELPWGATVADIVAAVPLTPAHEPRRRLFEVAICGHRIPRDRWHRIRPSAYADRLPITVIVRLPVRGGGGGNSGSGSNARKLVTAVAAIALIGLSLFSAGGGFAFLGKAFEAGAWGAKLLSAGLSMAATYLVQGLLASPASRQDDRGETRDMIGVAGAQNEFRPFGPMKRAIGRAKVLPDVVVPPFTAIDGGIARSDGSIRYDQFVTVVFGLAGRHKIHQILVGDVDIAGLSDIEYEVREGAPTDPPLTLVTDTRIEQQTNIQMSEWDTDPGDTGTSTTTIPIRGTVAEAEPKWHRVETKRDCDRFRLEFVLPSGLCRREGGDTPAAGLTVRLRMRPRESAGWGDWVQLPELLIRARMPTDAIRLHLEIVWVDAYPPEAGSAWPPTAKAWDLVKGWAAIHTHAGWASPLATPTGIARFGQWQYEAENRIRLFLLRSAYPQGRWQFEARRSWPFRWSDFNPISAILTVPSPATTTKDFFTPLAGNVLYLRPADFQDDLVLSSVQSVFHEPPIVEDGEKHTYVAIRARNRQLGAVSVVAETVCDDWNGTSWVPGQATRNPASLYRHVLRDAAHLVDPVEDDIIDMAALQDWHAWCAARGYEVGFVGDGRSWPDTLKLIAMAGFASPKDIPVYSVVIDRPRTGPVGLVSARNSWGHSFSKPFGDLPHAIRYTFADRDEDYVAREGIVYAPGYAAAAGVGLRAATRFESVMLESITSEAQAIARITLDLAWRRYRSMFHRWSMDIEALDYSRGDLVLYETDIMGRISGRGYIAQVLTSGANVTGLVLDEEVELAGGSASDLWLLPDLWLSDDLWVGGTPGIVIRRDDGVLITARVASHADPRRVDLLTPLPMPMDGTRPLIAPGGLVVTGSVVRTAREVLIWEIEPGEDLSANIIAVDYAAAQVYGS